MAYGNFCKNLLAVIYYPNHEETFFDQSASGLYAVYSAWYLLPLID